MVHRLHIIYSMNDAANKTNTATEAAMDTNTQILTELGYFNHAPFSSISDVRWFLRTANYLPQHSYEVLEDATQHAANNKLNWAE